jgi:mono/diheme cytochrome c family protein
MKHRQVSGLVAILVLIALPASQVGCGGDDDDGGATEATTTETATTETTTTEGAGGAAGEELFVSGCGSCHTLAAAGTTGTIGPNLDDLAPPKDEVLKVIAEGPGSMPAEIYTGKEAEQVADYVSSAAGSGS